jgi:hypothetical protein
MTFGISGVNVGDVYEITADDPIAGDAALHLSACGSSRVCPGSVGNLSDSSVDVAVNGTTVSISGYDPNKEYYAQVTFDPNTVSFSGLKTLIRDIVACRLGSQLYSRGGEDEWLAVKRACENSSEMLEKLESDLYWMPFEFRKLSYYPGTSPVKIKGGLTTFKTYRG